MQMSELLRKASKCLCQTCDVSTENEHFCMDLTCLWVHVADVQHLVENASTEELAVLYQHPGLNPPCIQLIVGVIHMVCLA